jgi:N-methylhydantoinase A
VSVIGGSERLWIGIDIGGTFTDVVALSTAGKRYVTKTPTNRENVGAGILEGLEKLSRPVGSDLKSLLAATARLAHGTTIGTNLVVERRGARTALISTAGHGDAITIMRGSGRVQGVPIEKLFHPQATVKPRPLVERELILEVDQRMDSTGGRVVPLDQEQMKGIVDELAGADGVEAVAIALLWSTRNPEDELLIADYIETEYPHIYVSCSHAVAGRVGEYERTVATVMNSYIGPRSTEYITGTQAALADEGYEGDLFIMQSAGGVIPAEEAAARPIATLDSGPVGGIIGCQVLARQLGHSNVIATDMGGTTFDVGMIVGGEALVTDEAILDQYRYRTTRVEVKSIACGGGSIARFDPHDGAIRLGPASAGSRPGPACYGHGSGLATVTDADVVLGLVDADRFLAGEMELDGEAAEAALREVGEPAGLDPTKTAAGLIQINDAKAALLLRQHTIERGYDPRDFVLYAYGGAGPVHAFDFARQLGVKEVVIPLGDTASALSAFGCATSKVIRYFDREETFAVPVDGPRLAAAVEALGQEAREAMEQMGDPGSTVRIETSALMRYVGQRAHHILVPLDGGDEIDGEGLYESFRGIYEDLYGEGVSKVSQGVEVFTLRVRASIEFLEKDLAAALGADEIQGSSRPSPVETREIFWPDAEEWLSTAIYDGTTMKPGDEVLGPASVSLAFTTVSVGRTDRLRVDGFGNHRILFDQNEELI